MYHIFHKKYGNWTSSCQNFNKILQQCSEETDEEEKEPIDIEFTEQKADPEMMKMLLTLDDQVHKKNTRKIKIWLTSLGLQKQTDENFFPKK